MSRPVLNTKISEVENKLKTLTAENFATRFKQATLVTKIDFDKKLTSFNNKIT